jgi:type III secretory pathway component EscU
MNEKQSGDQEQSMSELEMERRLKDIEAAAYLKAERRGFTPGHETEDWLDAEREVDEAAQPID